MEGGRGKERRRKGKKEEGKKLQRKLKEKFACDRPTGRYP